MRIVFFLMLVLFVVSCKNPFSNERIDASPEDFSIQNTENGEILLRLHPQVGEKTFLTMEVDVVPQQMLIPLDTHFVGDLKLRVADVDKDANTYTVDFQRIKLDTKLMGTNISYDSQGDNNNLPAALQQEIESILAKKVTMNLDSLAQMKSLEFDGNTKNLAANAIDLNTLFIPLPKNPVKVGDNWSAVQGGKNMEGKELTYTIEKISDDEVLVGLSSVNNQIKGQYLIDRKTGFTKKGNLQIESDKNGKGVGLNVRINTIQE